MELLVKNNLFTSGSKVLNEKNEKVYKVKGNWGSNTFTKKYAKKIMTMDKKLLYKVCNKRIHGLLKRSAIIYDANKKEIARVSENGAFKCGYQIEGTTEKMEIVGMFLGEGASIMLGGKKIGKIALGNYKSKSKSLANGKINTYSVVATGITDKFKLICDDPEDAPFLVAVIIAIDNIRDAYKRRAAGRGTFNVGR